MFDQLWVSCSSLDGQSSIFFCYGTLPPFVPKTWTIHRLPNLPLNSPSPMTFQIDSHQLPPNGLIRTHSPQAPSSSHIQRIPIAFPPPKRRRRRLRNTRRVDIPRHDRLRTAGGRHLGNSIRDVRGQKYVPGRLTQRKVIVRGAGEGVGDNYGVSLRRAVGVDLDFGQEGLRGVGEVER